MAGDRTRAVRPRWLIPAVIALALLGIGTAITPMTASAQGWQWPWDTDQAPRPREPMRRDYPAPQPQPQQRYGAPQYGAPPQSTSRGGICLELEQRLAQEANRGNQARNNLPEIENNIRETSRTIRSGETQLERQQCYEYFLFSKSLRRSSRSCVSLHDKVEQAKQIMAELEQRRQRIYSASGRSYRDDIVRELARNNCGETYSREASRTSNPFSSIWQDEGSGGTGGGNRFSELPFATYRTICVRLCDGYYFPVSFSTLPNHFERDAEVCQSKCAAPSELYFHQNPGAGMDQAISHVTKQPYNSLKTAFKYRKSFVQGCSCKSSEYLPQDQMSQSAGDAPAPVAGAPPSLMPQRR